MAYDAVRAQLDKMLGPDRNGPLTDSAAHATPHYTHSSVCKYYVLGFCPNDLHIKHRSEPGSCRLLHLDAAKIAFEKDDADGKVGREKLDWTRDLLKECRLILSDEDRKIRGHARRLQDTYHARGDLSGLMIRDFNTLKKLGMVSQDAQIKVWNENEDEEFDGLDVVRDNEPQVNGDVDKIESKGEENARNDGEGSTSEVVDEKGVKGSHDGEDDIDGFGIVAVIPAVKTKVSDGDTDEFGRVRNKKDDDAKAGEIKIESNDVSKSGHDSGDDDFADIEVISPTSHARERKACDSTSEEDSDDSGKVEDSDDSDRVTKVSGGTLGDEKGDGEETRDKKEAYSFEQANEKKAQPPKDVRQSGTSISTAGKDNDEANNFDKETDTNAGGEIEKLTPEQIMDKFYEAGEGPDGLVMLDRKQSLRVCACCGGFISLVDAESRLLSHYGGKSHHSLAVLRGKVVELDKAVSDLAARTVDGRDGGGRGYNQYRGDHEPDWSRRDRDYDRYRRADRSPGWTRRDNDYYPGRRRGGDVGGGRSRERAFDRSYERNGPRGGYDRHSDFGPDRTHGPGRRWSDERDHARDHRRCDSGRKRPRHPSPYRNSRRSRRY